MDTPQRTPAGPNDPSAGIVAPPADRLLQDLLDLAYSVSSRLRHHADRLARVSAALLLAASLAACSGGPSDEATTPPPVSHAAPLTQEVRSGLPTTPGHYSLVPGSISRDGQGVYAFSWMGEGGSSGFARASSLKLAPGETEELEMPTQGDPVLHVGKDTPIKVVESSTAGTTSNSDRGGGLAFIPAFWFPFHGGGLFGPGYYDPPRTVASGSTIEGGTRSTVPTPLSERVTGLDRAVSGRAGGTGSGTAATSKSGAAVGGKSGVASEVGAAAPKSGAFSAGKGSTGGIGTSGG